jgi:hypothetical protein
LVEGGGIEILARGISPVVVPALELPFLRVDEETTEAEERVCDGLDFDR